MPNPYDDLVTGDLAEAAGTANPYDSLIDQQRAGDVRSATMAAHGRNPDAYAKARQIAQRNGWPTDIVAADPAPFEQREEADRIEAAAKSDPALGTFLADPANVALAKDDTDTLTSLGGAIRMVLGTLGPNMLPSTVNAVSRMGTQEKVDVGRAVAAAPVNTLGMIAGGVGEGYSWLERNAVLRPVDALLGTDYVAGQSQTITPGELLKQSGAEYKKLGAKVGVPEERQTLATDIAGGVSQLGAQIVQAMYAPQTLVPSLFAMGTDLQADRAREAGQYGTVGADAAIAGGGVITAVTEKYGIDKLLNRLPPKIKNDVGRWLADGLAGGGIEAVQEMTEGLAQNLLTRLTFDDKQDLTGGLLRDAQAAGGAGAIARLAIRSLTHQRSVRTAQGEREALDGAVANALSSKTRERAPDQFEALLRNQAPDAMVYVPIEALTTLYQSEAVAAQAMVDLTESPDAWAEAVATGGEVAIPLSKYVTHLAEQHATLGGQVRLQPGQEVRPDTAMPTPEEIQADITAFLAEAKADDTRENGTLGEVYDEFYGQLVGTYGDASAAALAGNMQAAFRSMAAANGVTVEALRDKFVFNIEGENGPVMGQQRGIDTDIDPLLDAIRSKNLPDDRELFGDSLVSALVKAGGVTDPGGDLRSRDALKQRPGLVNLAGMRLDDAVNWAYDNGFINAPTNAKDGAFDNDAPDLNTLLDLISDELGGSPTYRQQADNPGRLKFRADALALAEELREQGIDIDVDDNATVRAKLFPDTLEQAAYHGSPHHFDKFSLQAMGTGEGAQAYGWGLYFASNKDIAEQYRVTLAEQNSSAPTKGFAFGGQEYTLTSAEGHALNLLKNGGKREAVSTAKEMIADAKAGKPYTQEHGRDLAHYERLLSFVQDFDAKKAGQIKTLRDKGQLYQVDVPDDGDLLDYDKPMSEQPEKVRAALAAMTVPNTMTDTIYPLIEGLGITDATTGMEIYKRIAARLGADYKTSEKVASEALMAAGIPGLRFLDGNSRNKGAGSHNYVIWDEAAISEPTTLYQSASNGSNVGNYENAEQVLQSRLEQWGAGIGADPARGFGFDRREQATGPAVGDAEIGRGAGGGTLTSRERKTAAGHRLIEAAKSGGFFMDDATTAEVARSAWRRDEGAEHDVHFVGEEGGELVVRSTANGNFGPMADITPEEYLQRLRDFNQVFPEVQVRTLGVSEDADGNAVIWTAQPFVAGEEFATQSELADAMEARGWKVDGPRDTPRFIHEATGAIIEDAHTGNILHLNGELFPIDVVVEKLPATLYQSAPQTETPAFRKWFGDSKVVDDRGAPLVVHHGAPDARFVQEDGVFKNLNERYGQTGGDRAFWFANKRATAATYADDRRAFDYQNAEAGVVDAYLKLENPLIVEGGGREWRDAQARGKTGDVIDEARAGGHDGVIIRNVRDDYTGFGKGNSKSVADTYVVFASSQIKSATANNGNFDPTDPSILNQPADGGSNPRGSITFVKDAQGRRVFNIRLLKGADLSTFLHEGGHAFLEMMGDLAADASAPAQVKADYAKVLAWFGVADRSEITVEHHEKFARGWEAYYREGKAPSSALRRSFARFKVWLTALYRTAGQLNVELTDEVRSVFDRMLATDAEIADAHTQVYHEALITDAMAVGMTGEQHDAYTRAVEIAKADAEAVLSAEVLKEQQRAQKAFNGEQRRIVYAEQLALARELPVYRALRWLRNGKLPNGDPVPNAIKLSKDALLDDLGQSFLRHLRGTYAVEGGVTPDVAAALLGYPSGSKLVHDLVNAPKLLDVVKADTDRIMAERYPDPMTDGSLPDRAMAAVHSKRQADMMLREVQALESHTTGSVRTQGHVLREVARQLIADKKVRHVQPASYRQAEAKAGREAFAAAAKQDWPAALAARRRQLLNTLLFTEATKAQDEAAKAGKYLKRRDTTKVRAAMGKAGEDFLAQQDAMLERFDLRKISGKAAGRRIALAEWITAKRADGVVIDLPPKLLDEAFRTPWQDLTVGELRELRDGIKHLAHLADNRNTLLLLGQRISREQVDAAMAQSVLDGHAVRPDRTGDETTREKARGVVYDIRAATGTATDIAREVDGFADGAAVWSNTVSVIREASQVVNAELLKAQEALSTLYLQHYSKAELRRFRTVAYIPEVNDSWSKGRILSLALNWGNVGNREAILTQSRGKLSPEQVGVLLGKLDRRDWAFVQGVWDQIDGHWPAIAEAHRKRSGLVPAKVDAAPFAMPLADGGTVQLRGGYFPLKYENDTAKGMREEADDFFDAIRTGQFSKASTKDGHTVERVGSGGRRVRLDLSVVDAHLRDVIRDVHLGDAVNYVYLAMRGPQFNQAVSDTGVADLVKPLETWLKDVASGEMGIRSIGEKVTRVIRTNFTAAVLTYKFVSAALQVTGIIQTSVVLGKEHTLSGVAKFARAPLAMGRYVNAASPFMAARTHSHVEAVQQVLNAQTGQIEAARQAMMRHGYWMIGRMQRTVDVATWLGAEAKGMELFAGDVKRARAYADDIVTRAQGSGEFIDKNPLQRGTLGDNVRQSEYMRATTALLGYMIAKSNAAYGRTRTTDFRNVGQGIRWAGDMVNLFVIEAMVVAAIRGQLPDDEDEDGAADDWLLFAAQEGAANLFGGIPLVGQGVSELRGYDAKGIIASAWGSLGNAIQQVKQGDLDKAALKSAVTLLGFVTGAPSSQINKTIDAIAAAENGEDIGPYDYLAGPPRD